jgi:putative effector of murein hydrolase LrgA (UPF0299 family)
VIVLTAVSQIVAKKIITQLLSFFFSLQLILLIYKQLNMQIPASTSLLINTLDGILSLSSVDKKAISQKLNISAGDLVDSLGGLSILGIVGGVLLLFVLLIIKFLRHPKIQNVVDKVKRFLMWNFCIRYFQVTFLNILFDVMS